MAGRDLEIEIWRDDAEGHRVGDGTASVGAPDRSSALRHRIQDVPEARDLSILAHLHPGREGKPIPVSISLGEAYAAKGEKNLAIEYYGKVLVKAPEQQHARIQALLDGLEES